MRNLVRQEVFDSSRTLIIKIGSNVLTRGDDQLDEDCIRHLSEQIDRLIAAGRKVVIVSSGQSLPALEFWDWPEARSLFLHSRQRQRPARRIL